MSVQVQPRASRYKDIQLITPFVIQPFNGLAPAGIFMDFIQHQQTRAIGEGFIKNFFTVFSGVPVEISFAAFFLGVSEILEEPLCQSRLRKKQAAT